MWEGSPIVYILLLYCAMGNIYIIVACHQPLYVHWDISLGHQAAESASKWHKMGNKREFSNKAKALTLSKESESAHPVDGSVKGDRVWERCCTHHTASLGQQGMLKCWRIRWRNIAQENAALYWSLLIFLLFLFCCISLSHLMPPLLVVVVHSSQGDSLTNQVQLCQIFYQLVYHLVTIFFKNTFSLSLFNNTISLSLLQKKIVVITFTSLLFPSGWRGSLSSSFVHIPSSKHFCAHASKCFVFGDKRIVKLFSVWGNLSDHLRLFQFISWYWMYTSDIMIFFYSELFVNSFSLFF